MKTLLPQVERRIIVRPNTSYGILSFDVDNAYPQRMLELVAGSPTAKDCWNKRAKYIGGNGFEEQGLGKVLVNGKGLTMAKLLKAVATDKALFTGFGIQVNYNANFEITEAHYVKFEDIRMGNTDADAYRGKYVLYNDWGRKTWKSIMRARFTVLDAFNPDPEVIARQVEAAGGWDEYKGQLFYFNPEVDDYPLIEADSVWEDFETEAGIKQFNNREVTTGFLPSTMLFMQSRREAADNASADAPPYAAVPTQLEKDLGVFQGARNAQKILVIEYEDESAKPELRPYDIQNNDKLFEVTQKAVESRIIKGFSVPKELINAEKASGLSNGGEKKEAIREFNDTTRPDRNDIAESFAAIFSRFHQPINPKGNWSIVEIPAIIADDAPGMQAGPDINNVLFSALPQCNKVAILVHAYGFTPAEAQSMVPADDWQPAAASAAGPASPQTQQPQNT